MSFDLLLKPQCSGCGSQADLYGSNCKHMTLCLTCGKTMAENKAKCFDCGAIVTRLIREYNVRPSASSNKNYFVGRFMSGLPSFSKKKNAENKWTLNKDGLQGRQVTDTLREKYKNKPWVLEDEMGQAQFQGHLEGSQTATYYLLVMHSKEFVAIPAGCWYNFNKVAQYKQLTLDEAEEKMKNRRKTADGYERWMMKAANNGAAAFGEVEKPDDKESAGTGGRGRSKKSGDEDEGDVSDRGEEDQEEETKRKNRLGLNKSSGDDDEEGPRGGDLDFDNDDAEKGDDWEHEEIFTDDDEAVGNDPEEREDLAPEVPAPPEIKQDEEDEDEEEGGLSKSGKELKKLLGRANGINESNAEDDDDDDDDDDIEDEIGFSSVLAPKQKDAPKKEEPVDNSPAKPAPSGSGRGTPSTSKSAKGKRKCNGDDAKASSGAPLKKVKTENETKSSATDENVSASSGAPLRKVKTENETKSSAKDENVSASSGAPLRKVKTENETKSSDVSASSGAPLRKVKTESETKSSAKDEHVSASKSNESPSSKTRSTSASGPVTADEISAVLLQKTPVTTQVLVAKFKPRLKSAEDRKAFADILKRISKIQKTNGPSNYVVLREK